MKGYPPNYEVLANRIRSNDEWLKTCENKHREEVVCIANYARGQREAIGISLRGFAQTMGISAMFLSDLERGNRNFTATTLEKWKAAMKKLSPTPAPDRHEV